MFEGLYLQSNLCGKDNEKQSSKLVIGSSWKYQDVMHHN